MRFENLCSTTRDDRTPASLRIGAGRRMPGVPTARATSPRRDATCVRGFAGRLASSAQSGRSCIRGVHPLGLRGGAC